MDGVVSLEENVIFTADEEVAIDEEAVNELAKNGEEVTISQWNMDAVNIPFDTGLTGSGVKVADLDSGISFTEDVRITDYVDLTNSGNENPLFNDSTGHGTSVASVIAATGSTDLYGIAPETELYDVKILDDTNTAPLSRVIEGIYWCIDNDIDIINMSFGTTAYSEALKQAVDDAEEAGIIMVASAGNNGENATSIDYPAAFENVIAVGASNGNNTLTDFTSHGDGIDILAPGEKVWSHGVFQGLQTVDGTSIAAAHVSGATALLLEKYPDKDTEFIRQLFIASSNKEAGGENLGIINIANAVSLADGFEVQEVFETITPQNPSSESYDTSQIVSGSWGSVRHGEMISVLGNTSELAVAASSASKVDELYSSKASEATNIHCKPLHGVHNYVANLHFLYKAARDAEGIALNNTSAVTQFVNGLTVACSTDKTYGASDLALLRTVLIDACTGANGMAAQVGAGTNNQKIYMILGIAAHLLADTFSHRTMVPASATGGSSKGDTRFNKNDFSNWTDFQQRFKATVIEFRDINNYLKSSADNVYTDRINFFSNRYSATKEGVATFFRRYDNDGGFGIKNFYLNTGFTGQLNNFQAYVNSAGYGHVDVSACSTSNYRVDRPNGSVTGNENDYVDYPHYLY